MALIMRSKLNLYLNWIIEIIQEFISLIWLTVALNFWCKLAQKEDNTVY